MSEIKKLSRTSFFTCLGLAAICLLASASLFVWESDLKPVISSDRPTAEEIELAVNSLEREKLAEFFNFVLHGHREIQQSLDGMVTAAMQFTYLVFFVFAVLFIGVALSFRKILHRADERPD